MVHLIPWRNKQHACEQPENAFAGYPARRDGSAFRGLHPRAFRRPGLAWAGRGQWVPTIDISDSDDEVVERRKCPASTRKTST